jgi:hypothetical protein
MPAVGGDPRGGRDMRCTLVPRYYGGPATDPPNRLLYLLDHEYTPCGLNWRWLQGADATRVAQPRGGGQHLFERLGRVLRNAGKSGRLRPSDGEAGGRAHC